ncbi:MAG: sulfatase [Puniceicoccaceae bacterium]
MKTRLTALPCFLVACLGCIVHSLPADRLPNIIFLMSDDQSTYSIGIYGNEDVQTPNLDKLSDDGITFDRHYVTTAVCMASRATVMAGMYEYKTGCNFPQGNMMRSTWNKTYPMLLRQAGYETAFAGKFGFEVQESPSSDVHGLPSGDFDRWGGSPGQTSYKTRENASMATYADEYPHSTLSYAAFSRDFILEHKGSKTPFCLSISFKAPHRPTTPDPKFDHVYAGKTFRKPANFGREHGKHFPKHSRQDRQYERFHSWNYSDKYDEVMAIYHQQIYAVDVAIGWIRNALKEAGLEDNTVIIYTSDNGFFCGSHGLGSKILPYEESSRVPLIIYDPRKANSGKRLRSSSLTANIDFAPTILELAGIPVPLSMDGKSLMSIYDNPEHEIHEAISLINIYKNPAIHTLSIVTKDMKYIYWGYAGEGFEATEELYDLGRDPLELRNEANNPEYSDIMKRMQQSYDEHLIHWKSEAVPYNDYQRFGDIFDRHIAWPDKQALVN